MDRESLLHSAVSTGGAMLLAYAAYARAAHKATPRQIRGLVLAGIGFLMSAGASIYLRAYGPRGAAVSLLGTLLAMAGMMILVRERAAERDAKGRPGNPRPR